MIDLILGTAGHIDHGKSSLIRALTGVDPDRLPEEKKRGITIELGFAELELEGYRFGIVDVPGHERFIRNMLAGASGIDVAMLVVAADDSIKPQTREHLDILRMLELQSGVIAVTKSDLADPDWIPLVMEEIQELVKGSFLETAPIIPVSSKTGANLDRLKAALVSAAARIDTESIMPRRHSPFRLPIDRVFTIDGHGTVVTGSVVSGEINVGEEIVLQPGNRTARIRGLQNHDRQVETIHRGQRAAINISGIHHGELTRGQELCAPGYLSPSDLLNVNLRLLSTGKLLKDRQKVRVHIGTVETPATLRLLEEKQLRPGESALAQLFLRESVVSVWHQPFVIRDDSATHTLGGGLILHPNANRQKVWSEDDLMMLKGLDSKTAVERISAAYYFDQSQAMSPEDIKRITGISEPSGPIKQLEDEGVLLAFNPSPTQKRIVHKRQVEQLGQRITKRLALLHERNPLQSKFSLQMLRHHFEYVSDDEIFKLAIRSLGQLKQINTRDGSASLVGHGPQLSRNEQKNLDQIVELFQVAKMEPPTLEECCNSVAKSKDSVPQLIDLAIANGDLERISKEIVLHQTTANWIQTEIVKSLELNKQGLTMAEIRDLLGTTRKYAVPICEYLDRIGVTVREGDTRTLSENQSASN